MIAAKLKWLSFARTFEKATNFANVFAEQKKILMFLVIKNGYSNKSQKHTLFQTKLCPFSNSLKALPFGAAHNAVLATAYLEVVSVMPFFS